MLNNEPAESPLPLPLFFDVVIVGAGVAGTSAAYHLWQEQQQQQPKPKPNTSDDSNSTNNSKNCNKRMSRLLLVDAADQAGQGRAPRYSGTATLQSQSSSSQSSPSNSKNNNIRSSSSSCVKMMVQLYASSSEEFVRHHGTIGAQRYLRATAEGLVYQKQIAQEIILWKTKNAGSQQTNSSDSGSDSNPADNLVLLRELGSYYVAYQADEEALRHEYKLLQQLLLLECGDDSATVEWCDRDRLRTVTGMSRQFHCAIYFPHDAVIDSQLYTQTLLQYMTSYDEDNNNNNDNTVQFCPNTTVRNVTETESHAVVEFESGQTVHCRHVVMATGGLFPTAPFLDPRLLKACYSYLVHVPIKTNADAAAAAVEDDQPTTTTTTSSCDYSPNFFTWRFTHDWCWTEGRIRCSGEDHFSAAEPPYMEERCGNLIQWTRAQYNCMDNTVGSSDKNNNNHNTEIPQQYGVYSETPDLVPLVGHWNSNNNNDTTSRICYLMGCNAWGQTILSYCSSLIPGLLGYRDLTESEQDCMRLVTIRRFAPRLPPVPE